MNRYANLTPSKKISEDFQNINTGFDKVEQEMDEKASGDALIGLAQEVVGHIGSRGDAHTNATQTEAGFMSSADKDKLNHIEAGAEKNKPAFAHVNDVAAADPEDVLTIEGGVGVTVTTNPATKKVTITATGEAIPGAHGSSHTEHGADPIPNATETEGGLMSSADKLKLDNMGGDFDELAGPGRTTETVKGNADAIAALNAETMIQTASGTKNAITITTGGNFEYKQGNRIAFKATLLSDNDVTINVDGKGAKPFLKPDGSRITVKVGKVYDAYYDTADGGRFFGIASAEGDAVVANVLAGKIFSNDDDTGIIGTMVDRGAVTQSLATEGASYTIPAGYHNGSGKVTATYSAGASLKGVQRGTAIIGPNSSSVSVTVSSYTMANAYLKVRFDGMSQNPSVRFVRGALTNTTTITFTRAGSIGASGDDVYVYWELIEYTSIKSIKRGQLSLISEASKTATLSPAVNMSRSFIEFSYSCTKTASLASDPYVVGELISTTGIRFKGSEFIGTVVVEWFVIEY